jgi:hypothetical protein
VDCQAAGTDPSDVAGLLACVVQEHARSSEQLIGVQTPRAWSLLDRCNLPSPFPAPRRSRVRWLRMVATVVCRSGSAKSVAKCTATLSKSGSAISTDLQKRIQTCVSGLYACAQLVPDDLVCRAKAALKCTQGIVKIPASIEKLRKGLDKSCNLPSCALRAAPRRIRRQPGRARLRLRRPSASTSRRRFRNTSSASNDSTSVVSPTSPASPRPLVSDLFADARLRPLAIALPHTGASRQRSRAFSRTTLLNFVSRVLGRLLERCLSSRKLSTGTRAQHDRRCTERHRRHHG